MKKLFLTLIVIILSVSFYPVKAMEKTSDILKKNVVTTGDGLYVDSTIDGRYIYRGANPNNYIKLGDDLYRIISLEKDGTIKVVKQESIGEMPWDEKNTRYSTNSDDFCTSQDGCKSWGSKTTTLDKNGNKVTQMPLYVNETLKNLPDREATLNTYLNNDFYNGLSDDVKSLIVESTWNVGPTTYNQTDLLESLKEESSYKWKGKVALMNATDYVKSSTNSACTSTMDYAYIHLGGNPSCYNNSGTHNYLYSNNFPWALSPSSYSNANYVFEIGDDGSLGGSAPGFMLNGVSNVRPAFYLSSETTLNGEGTEESPYTVSKYVEEPKEENKDKNEVEVDNAEVVEVPSTSAFGSVVIVILGIICIISSLIINKYMTKKAK